MGIGQNDERYQMDGGWLCGRNGWEGVKKFLAGLMFANTPSMVQSFVQWLVNSREPESPCHFVGPSNAPISLPASEGLVGGIHQQGQVALTRAYR